MTCLVCGADLPPNSRPHRKYCSWQCNRAWLRENREPRTCPQCGSEFKNHRLDAKYCSVQCSLAAARTAEHQQAAAKVSAEINKLKRGEHKEGSKRYVKYEGRHWHRVKGEAALGRPLRDGEIVHHIDCNPKNNDNSNLMIMTQKYHAWLHHEMRKRGLPPRKESDA